MTNVTASLCIAPPDLGNVVQIKFAENMSLFTTLILSMYQCHLSHIHLSLFTNVLIHHFDSIAGFVVQENKSCV